MQARGKSFSLCVCALYKTMHFVSLFAKQIFARYESCENRGKNNMNSTDWAHEKKQHHVESG